MKNIILFLAGAPLLMAADNPGKLPEMERSWKKRPEMMSTEIVRHVIPGMTRHQVYIHLGSPHFSEGIGSRNWSYAFDLSKPGKAEGMNCQLKIQFENRRVARLLWKTESCAGAIK